MPTQSGPQLLSIGQIVASRQGCHTVQTGQCLSNASSLEQPRQTHVPSQTGQGDSSGPASHSSSPRHNNGPTAFSNFGLPRDFSLSSMSPDTGLLDNSPEPQMNPDPQHHSRLGCHSNSQFLGRQSPQQHMSSHNRDPQLHARLSPSPPSQGTIHPGARCNPQSEPQCNDDPQALRSFPAQSAQGVQFGQKAGESLHIKSQDGRLAEGTELPARAKQSPAASSSPPGNSGPPAVRQGPRIKTTVRVGPAGHAQQPAIQVVASRRVTVSAKSPIANLSNPTAISPEPQAESSSPTDRLLSSDASISQTTVTDDEEPSPSPEAITSTQVADKLSRARDELDCSERLGTESPPSAPLLTQQAFGIPSSPSLEHHALPQGPSEMMSSQPVVQMSSSDTPTPAAAPQHNSAAAKQIQLIAAQHQRSSMIACSTPMFAGSHGPTTAPEQATMSQQALADQQSQTQTTSTNHQPEQALRHSSVLAREGQQVLEGTLTTNGQPCAGVH